MSNSTSKPSPDGLKYYRERDGDVTGTCSHVMTLFYRDLKYRNNEILYSQDLDNDWTYSESEKKTTQSNCK